MIRHGWIVIYDHLPHDGSRHVNPTIFKTCREAMAYMSGDGTKSYIARISWKE